MRSDPPAGLGLQCCRTLFLMLLLHATVSDGSGPVSCRARALLSTKLLRLNNNWMMPMDATVGVLPEQQQRHDGAAPGRVVPPPSWYVEGNGDDDEAASLGNAEQQRHQDSLRFRKPALVQLPYDGSGWMTQCCAHKRLRDLYLPGTHDSGTAYPWTVPAHLPLVFDEVAALIFNIVGDLSRTQHLTVYEQLQAGARVLDIRLAVNPWIPLQARTQQQQHLPFPHTRAPPKHYKMLPAASDAVQRGSMEAEPLASLQDVFTLDVQRLEGTINFSAAGGPLRSAELPDAVVVSHSLPGAPLAHVLADVRRFLVEQPSEVVILLVKSDTVDVNAAGIQRMDDAAWAAAAQLFRHELAAVQQLSKKQVEQQPLGQLAATAPQGSVLIYSRELQQQGLPCVSSAELQILESWGNGTNAEELPDLKSKLLTWLQYWQGTQWRQKSKPYMLMASAEVTLGVQTILKLIKNRIWLTAQQQEQEQQQQQQQQQQRRGQWKNGVIESQQQRDSLLQHYLGLQRLGIVRSLFDMGMQTNQEMLTGVLQNNQALNAFNVWSLDALSSDITSYIIGLNNNTQQRWQQKQQR